jgi:hypothetical protein
MSNTLKAVLDRTMRDEAFLQTLRSDPDEALDEYSLDDEEYEALVAGDERRITELLASPGSSGYMLLQNNVASH